MKMLAEAFFRLSTFTSMKVTTMDGGSSDPLSVFYGQNEEFRCLEGCPLLVRRLPLLRGEGPSIEVHWCAKGPPSNAGRSLEIKSIRPDRV